MLDDWLATTTLATFRATHWQQQPLAGAASAARAVPLLSWDTIDRVLRSDRELDVLTVAGGRLAMLADSFARLMPGEVHVQLYATPRGTNSFGWHYDFEDVFVVQTDGVKDYYLRANSTARDTRLGDKLDFSSVRAERSPLLSSRLLPGDWLYIPSRWWHLVKCVEDSLSISVGVMGPDTIRRAHHLPRGWGNYGTGRTA